MKKNIVKQGKLTCLVVSPNIPDNRTSSNIVFYGEIPQNTIKQVILQCFKVFDRKTRHFLLCLTMFFSLCKKYFLEICKIFLVIINTFLKKYCFSLWCSNNVIILINCHINHNYLPEVIPSLPCCVP